VGCKGGGGGAENRGVGGWKSPRKFGESRGPSKKGSKKVTLYEYIIFESVTEISSAEILGEIYVCIFSSFIQMSTKEISVTPPIETTIALKTVS